MDIALAAILLGSNVALRMYREGFRYSFDESRGSEIQTQITTEIDSEVQKTISTYLSMRRPHDGILAEEGDFSKRYLPGNPHWLNDPVCGTLGAKKGKDTWGTSLAYINQFGIPEVGVLANACRNWLCYAAEDSQAILDGKPLKLHRVKTSKPRVILSVNRLKSSETLNALKALQPEEVNCMESTVTKALMVFRGESDLFFGLPKIKLPFWELPAVAIIAKKVGYILTDFDGNEFTFPVCEDHYSYRGFILSHPVFYKDSLEKLNSSFS